MTAPQCEKCGRFISYSRAKLASKFLNHFEGHVEWWEGTCERCEKKETQP